MLQLNFFCLPSIRTKFPDSRTVCNSFHVVEVAALLHRCGWMFIFGGERGVQVCALHMCFDISVHSCVDIRCRVCTCARVCAVCSLALADESGWVQLVYTRHFLLAWGVIFDKRIDRSVVCVFSIFWWGLECVCVCVCVYARTHTQHAGYSMWVQVWDGHLES